MTISNRDLLYWYRQFRTLLSGWTTKEQIQFHKYAIRALLEVKRVNGQKEVDNDTGKSH